MTDPARRLPWRHRMSLRTRISGTIAIVVTLILTAVGLVVLDNVKSQLYGGVDQVVRLKAAEIADLAAGSELPTHIPVTADTEYFIEVIQRGHVVSSTDTLGESNFLDFPEQPVGRIISFGRDWLPIGEEGHYRIAAYGVETPSGTMTVFVATSVSDMVETLGEETRIGAIGLFVLMLILGFLMSQALRRAIAPMDEIRAQADVITGTNLDSRVPEPVRLDEIGRLARTVNRMLDRLERNDERQRRFVADAAHELRSPIASLRVQLETSRDGTGIREEDLLHETMRMEILVEQLLLLAHADSNKSWLDLSPTDLDDVADAAVASVALRDGVTIDTGSVEPVQLIGNANSLEQLVRNLTENAVLHARRAVRVSVSAAGGMAVVVVEDDGPGVPTEHREDVFERFVRLDGARDREAGGSGLGLSIVKEIAHAHGGDVRVGESEMGGARFVVELPVSS